MEIKVEIPNLTDDQWRILEEIGTNFDPGYSVGYLPDLKDIDIAAELFDLGLVEMNGLGAFRINYGGSVWLNSNKRFLEARKRFSEYSENSP